MILGELLGLEFKGVSTEDEADFVAEIGYRLEGGAYYCSPNEAGCATIDASNEMGELEVQQSPGQRYMGRKAYNRRSAGIVARLPSACICS